MTNTNLKFVFTCSPADFTTVDEAIAYITAIQNAFAPTPTGDGPIVPASRGRTYGPIAQEWFRVQGVSRVRCTEGRSVEDQAAHNLISYNGYTQADIDAIKNGGTALADLSTQTPTLDTSDMEIVYDAANDDTDVDPESLV